MSDPRLSMIGAPRIKGNRVLCSAIRCPQELGTIADPLLWTIHLENGEEEPENDGAGIFLDARLDNWKSPDVWEFNPRPRHKRAATKREERCHLRLKSSLPSPSPQASKSWAQLSPAARERLKESYPPLIRGLDNQDSWNLPGDGELPIVVKCPRCGKLTRLTRENLMK